MCIICNQSGDDKSQILIGFIPDVYMYTTVQLAMRFQFCLCLKSVCWECLALLGHWWGRNRNAQEKGLNMSCDFFSDAWKSNPRAMWPEGGDVFLWYLEKVNKASQGHYMVFSVSSSYQHARQSWSLRLGCPAHLQYLDWLLVFSGLGLFRKNMEPKAVPCRHRSLKKTPRIFLSCS